MNKQCQDVSTRITPPVAIRGIRQMRGGFRALPAVLALSVFAAIAADEPQGLSLAAAQPLHTGEVLATGRVVPRFRALIGSRLSGRITEWWWLGGSSGYPLDVGMPVKAGDKLFVVDPSTFKAHVDSAQAALTSAEATLANLRAPTRPERIDALRASLTELDVRIQDRERDVSRYTRLVEVEHTMPAKRLEEVRLELDSLKAQRRAAQARLDEAIAGPTKTEIAVAEARVGEARAAMDSAQLDLRDTVVTAPFDGIITRRMKGLGDYVSGAPFVEVLELTTSGDLEAELSLPEAYLTHVAPGQTRVTLKSPALTGELTLAITRIIPEIDAQRGTFAFRVGIPGAQRGALVVGSFVSAALNLNGEQSVIIPQRAIFTDGGRATVLVSDGTKMSPRVVEPGNRLTEGVVIKSGLRSGEKVVLGLDTMIKEPAPLPSYLVEKPL